MTPPQKVNFGKTMKRLATYLRPYRGRMIVTVFASLLSVIFGVFTPKLFGDATTLIVASYNATGQVDFAGLGRIAALIIICFVGAALLNYLSKFIVTKVTSEVVYQFRRTIKEKLTRVPIRFYDEQSKGDLISRTVNDANLLGDNMMQVLMQLLLSLFQMIGVIVMMFLINWQLALLAIIGLPISSFSVGFIVKKSQSLFIKQQQQLGALNGHIEENYAGHEIVKSFNYENRSIKQFDELNEQLYQSGWKAQFYSGLMMPISRLINNLVYVLICVVGGLQAVGGVVTLGAIQSILQYTQQLSQPLGEVANMMNMLQSAAAAAERLFELLDSPEMPEDTAQEMRDIQGNIQFNHVVFGYSPDKPLMSDLNIDVKAGETVAIVGPTGAGKTTVINLLMRFYDINSGQIILDGHDINDYSKHSLRQNIGMVLQDTWLFQGTIMENIRYGKPDATDEQVIRAAKQAYADEFIRKLPHGYQSIINEQSDNISQGQKQLLTIARAILAEPEIFILDEATSNIDTRTEMAIQSAMDQIMNHKTSFVIAHRLSTIKNADKILVMQHGDVVEYGTHHELLKRDGIYAGLYNAQFEQ